MQRDQMGHEAVGEMWKNVHANGLLGRHGEPQRYVPKETGLKLPLRFCLIIKPTVP